MLFIIMNETEKRRLDLLARTRNIYNEKNTPPAVHPRYGAAFRFLYGEAKEEEKWVSSTLWARFLIAVFIFVLVFVIDARNQTVGNINSKTVISEVRKDLFSQ